MIFRRPKIFDCLKPDAEKIPVIPEPEPSELARLHQERIAAVAHYDTFLTIKNFCKIICGNNRHLMIRVLLEIVQSINTEDLGD